jgi:hypothetical protein
MMEIPLSELPIWESQQTRINQELNDAWEQLRASRGNIRR